MKILSDEVIALLNKKQEAAFEVAFNLYYPRLVYFAKEYISDEDAKNAVQDAFISFWEKKPQLLSELQLQSYLYTTVIARPDYGNRQEKAEMPDPRFTSVALSKYIPECRENGGAVTINSGIYQDGTVGLKALQVMKEVRVRIRKN